jgi:hypothetical protein
MDFKQKMEKMTDGVLYNTICGQNEDFVVVKAGGTWVLKG